MVGSMSMPDGDFEAISFFSGEGMGGRVWMSLTQPRLRFCDTFYQSGKSSREWIVDGEIVASREEAEDRLKVAPLLTANEASVLAWVGVNWTVTEHLLTSMDARSEEASTQERVDDAIKTLIEKGMIEPGRSGVRLRRPWKKQPDPELQRRDDPADRVYFHRGPTDVVVDAGIRELAPALDLKLRLVPVLTWPEHRVPAHIPSFRGKIDVGAIDDEYVLLQVVLAQLGRQDLSDPEGLDGCCILLEADGAGRVLFEPKRRIGLRDIASWQAAAAGVPLQPQQMQDARTGWMKLNIGDWLAVLPQGDRVYLGTTGEFDGLPLRPYQGWPIWNVNQAALQTAVDEASAVVDRVAALLYKGLEYEVPEDRRDVAVSRLIRPVGPF